jgi:geranylgeranyl diphosphate synthase type II
MSVRQRPSTLSEVLLMGERKTAMYSFALPMQAAAVLAGAPEEAVEAVGRVGSALGVAFQLADDLDGMFGDPEVTGKSAVSDLRGGKHTALIAHARGTAAWSDIEPFVGSRTLTPAEAERVRRCLTSCGSRRFVQQLADEHRAEAKALAALAGLPLPMVEVVRTIADDLIGGTA